MNKGKITRAKHTERRHKRSVKTTSRSTVRKKTIDVTETGDDRAPGTHEVKKDTYTETTQLVVHDISREGMKAFSRLLEELRSDSGATLLLAHHLNPEHQRQLTELLSLDLKREADEVIKKLETELEATRKDRSQYMAEVARLGDDLSNVLRTSRDPLVVIGKDLSIRCCSSAATTSLKIDSNDIGRKITGVSLGVQIPDLKNIVATVITSSNAVQKEIQDDRGRWLLLSAHPHIAGDGKVDGAVLTFLDIEADKQNEALLRAQEAKEQQYRDIVPGILMSVDVQGCVTMMSKSGCELLGLKEAEIVGRKWIYDFVPRSHWIVARTIFDQAIEGKLTEEYEYPVTTKGGEERIISWRTVPVKDQAGNITGLICSGEDLTLLRQMNNALQKSEERFHVMMESVREDEFFIMDTEGYIVSWIALHEEGKSYRAGEMVGQHFSCLYVPEDFQSGRPMRILDMAEAEGRFEEDGWRMRKDGTRMKAYVIILPIRDEARNLLGFSNVTRYIREKTMPRETPVPAFMLPLEQVER